MKVVALVSGGKDSTYNMMQCIAAGHTIVALANIEPESHDELDSYMYQSVGNEGVALLGKAIGLPLYRKITKGKAHNKRKDYTPTLEDEVEDLYELLQTIKNDLEYDAVAVGAILSDYQRIRVENICARLNLISLAYLWRRNQADLLAEMIECGIKAVIVKVAALGLEPSRHLGVPLGILRPHLQRMNQKYGLNICGEGGEYETFTLDSPLYANSIVVDDSETVIHSDDGIASVGYVRFKKIHLNPKENVPDLKNRLNGVPIKDPLAFIADIDTSDDKNSIEEVSNSFDENSELEKVDGNSEIAYTPPLNDKNSCFEHLVNSSRSRNGWLWIGGLVGYADNPTDAMVNALSKLQSCLSKENYTIRDVCAVTMYISDMQMYAELNSVYCKAFKYLNPPARVCVQCPLEINAPVILDALAYSAPSTLPIFTENNVEDDQEKQLNRLTLHVQGISHWAPANIGPYSQAIQVGDIIRVAGQIGMVPGTLELIEGGVLRQCRISLRHVGRIVGALDPNMQLRDVVQGICYVTNPEHISIARKEWEKHTNNSIVDYLVVSKLPKNALVEWHLWAHKHNNQFEYEETGQCIDDYLLSIRRRFNYENRVAAIVCYVEHHFGTFKEITCDLITAVLEYALSKLTQDYPNDCANVKPVCDLRFFYSITHNVNLINLHTILTENRAKYNFVFTIIPVCQLQSTNTLLSICGVRYE